MDGWIDRRLAEQKGAQAGCWVRHSTKRALITHSSGDSARSPVLCPRTRKQRNEERRPAGGQRAPHGAAALQAPWWLSRPVVHRSATRVKEGRRPSRERGPALSANPRLPPLGCQLRDGDVRPASHGLWPGGSCAAEERGVSILPLPSDKIMSDTQDTATLLKPGLRIFLTGRCISRLWGAPLRAPSGGPCQSVSTTRFFAGLKSTHAPSLFIFGYQTFNFSKPMSFSLLRFSSGSKEITHVPHATAEAGEASGPPLRRPAASPPPRGRRSCGPACRGLRRGRAWPRRAPARPGARVLAGGRRGAPRQAPSVDGPEAGISSAPAGAVRADPRGRGRCPSHARPAGPSPRQCLGRGCGF